MSWAIHNRPPRYIHDRVERIPGGRALAQDAYATDYDRLNAVSHQRMLTLPESLRLEECIRVLDRRAYWRARNRGRA